MRFSKSSFTRAATVVVSTGLAMGGAVALAPAANAALTETNYGFQSTAYGTRLQAPLAQIGLPRTAFSFVSCTRLAGRTDSGSLEQDVLGEDVANSIPVTVHSIATSSRSFKDLKNNIAAASQGQTTIGKIALGGIDGGPELTLDGLKTVSTAWADKAGKLHAKNTVSALDIDLDLGGYVPETGTPLDQLVDVTTGTVDDVLDQVVAVIQDSPLGKITIPGLGEISLTGFDRHGVSKGTAYASSFLLRLDLFGLDGDPQTLEDNTTLSIGRSWARITKGVRSGVMSGVGVGSRISSGNVLGDIGDLAWKQLPCEGTRGNVLTRKLSTQNVGLQVPAVISQGSGSSYGVQRRDGRATAWTRGKVASFTVNGTDLVLEGITGRTNVKQLASGRVVTNYAGSRIGRILVGGKVIAEGVTPRTARTVELPSVPGVASVKLFARDTWRRGGSISAVKVVLADAVSPISVKLGFSRAAIKRF